MDNIFSSWGSITLCGCLSKNWGLADDCTSFLFFPRMQSKLQQIRQ